MTMFCPLVARRLVGPPACLLVPGDMSLRFSLSSYMALAASDCLAGCHLSSAFNDTQ